MFTKIFYNFFSYKVLKITSDFKNAANFIQQLKMSLWKEVRMIYLALTDTT